MGSLLTPFYKIILQIYNSYHFHTHRN